jgi:serine/threonine protein kinase
LIAYEVLRVVAACHERSILHGDIKPANFILRDRKSNPLGSPQDPRWYGVPWLAAIDLGCAQHLGPEVRAGRGGGCGAFGCCVLDLGCGLRRCFYFLVC